MSCHAVRPLLPARAEELTPTEALIRAEHVATCSRCATEAAAYSRLGQALAVMANLEAEPAAGTLEQILVVIGRRRTRVTDPRVLAAAGSAGALVATVVVARALRQRRQSRPAPAAAPWPRRLRVPGLPLPAAALARAK
jgi:anti-sigma factor ChrR (cupin superfamily)